MSKTTAPVAATTAHKLAPTVTSKAKAKSVAAADGRKRPIVAINEEGKLVVCCRRTAKKNGWNIQEVLYERAKPAKVEAPVVVPAKTKKAAPKAKKTLSEEVSAEVSALLSL